MPPTPSLFPRPAFRRAARPASALLLASLAAAHAAPPLGSVLTQHYDNARTGVNPNETVLTPFNVNSTRFGKLFSDPVDGVIFGAPLVAPNLAIPGKGTRNVVFVATGHDSVYAFDADAAGAPLWKTSFLSSGVTPIPNSDTGGSSISPEVGITGTPVIDTDTGTIYVEASTKEVAGTATTFHQRLHALDILTGQERSGSPVEVAGAVTGLGYHGQHGLSDAVNGKELFDPVRDPQRVALLLSNGVVYFATASHYDRDPYHGWIFGYHVWSATDPNSLAIAANFSASPNGNEGGIWQSGGGLSADADGNVFVVIGNGTFDTAPTAASPRVDWGDSILKMQPAAPGDAANLSGLTVTDFFTPYNEASLESTDADLGSSPPLLIPDQAGPHRRLAVANGKDGNTYMVDRDAMGGFGASSNNIVQTVSMGVAFCTPAFWDSLLFYGINSTYMKAYSLGNGRLSSNPIVTTADGLGYTPPSPCITSQGPLNGVLWAAQLGTGSPIIFRAYEPTTLGTPLYVSSSTGGRDTLGAASNFTTPTIVNGKAYLQTRTELDVLGLLPESGAPTLVSASAVNAPNTVTLVFSHPVDQATAETAANYALSGGATVLSATLRPDRQTVVLSTTALSQTADTTVTVNGVQDRAAPPNTIAANTAKTFRAVTLNGDGLTANIYNGTTFSGAPLLTRVDPVIAFNWGSDAPAAGVPADNFSIRWTGFVTAPTSDTYTFYATTDDGVRVTVNGQVLIDNLVTQSATEKSGSIALTAGQKTPITVEYYDATGGASAILRWSSPSVYKTLVPQAALSSGAAPAPFTLADAQRALAIAAGLATSTTDDARLNVEAPAGIDLADALRLARKAATLDPNP